jgi:hypothetical protein
MVDQAVVALVQTPLLAAQQLLLKAITEGREVTVLEEEAGEPGQLGNPLQRGLAVLVE